ncbi:TetR/AcrR family transcriptional regulator [Aestuariibius sp. 2305UL40-4]|uniref:TetR/AcrR family transcriptional regulator n=1 Tax=Aestuariibius violaceus TaxID=3234132 RepID=UPI00345E2B97
MTRISGADRRQQIIEAAHAVILEKGLAQAATRDVTRRLGVGSGLLHHYFKSWQTLRAEAVRHSVESEIAQLQQTLDRTPPPQWIELLVDWMTADGDLHHWSLWLNAVDEARRDTELAEVVRAAYIQWQQVVIRIIDRLVEDGIGHRPGTPAAAGRLCALVDGLAGAVFLGEQVMTPQTAKSILRDQIKLDLGLSS